MMTRRERERSIARPVGWVPGFRFLAGFGLLLAGYYWVILLPWGDRALYAYLRVNAWLSNSILQLVGEHTTVTDVTIRATGFALAVRRGCDALEPAWFFCAAILAFPAPWRRKTVALLVGASGILALNLVRIVSLFLIGRRFPAFFVTAHLELWPAGFILLAVSLWLLWIRSIRVPAGTDSDVVS